MQLVLSVNPADIRTIFIDVTTFAGRIVVSAGAISPIEELGFGRQMDVLAAQATLRTGEWRSGHGNAGHDSTEDNEEKGPRREHGPDFQADTGSSEAC